MEKEYATARRKLRGMMNEAANEERIPRIAEALVFRTGDTTEDGVDRPADIPAGVRELPLG